MEVRDRKCSQTVPRLNDHVPKRLLIAMSGAC